MHTEPMLCVFAVVAFLSQKFYIFHFLSMKFKLWNDSLWCY